MNPASINRTFDSPFNLRRQMANSSLDSMSQMTHCVGGARYREHPLHQLIAACLGIPSVMSMLEKVRSSARCAPFPLARCDSRVSQAIDTEVGTVGFDGSTAVCRCQRESVEARREERGRGGKTHRRRGRRRSEPMARCRLHQQTWT